MSVVGILIYIPSTLPDRRKENPGFTNSVFKNQYLNGFISPSEITEGQAPKLIDSTVICVAGSLTDS